VLNRIVLAGGVFSPNLGDRIIADCMCSILTDVVPDAAISRLDWALRPEHLRPENSLGQRALSGRLRSRLSSTVHSPLKESIAVYSRVYSHFRSLSESRKVSAPYADAIRGADWVLIGGGQLIMDNSLVFPARISSLVRRAERDRIPVGFFGVGVGKSWSRKGRNLVACALSSPQVCGAVVRDEVSRQRLKELFPEMSAPVIKSIDPALIAGTVYGISARSERDLIGVGVIDPGVVRRHDRSHPLGRVDALEYWVRLCRALLSKGKRICLFCNGELGDQHFAEQVATQVNSPEGEDSRDIIVASRPIAGIELARIIKRFEVVIAARMHASIVATSLGVPSMGLMWDDKLRGFFHDLGRDEHCITDFRGPEATAEQAIENSKEKRKEFEFASGVRRKELLDAARHLVSLVH
jgi:polysaccharide pyruvyl transferase WcaK-like protein